MVPKENLIQVQLHYASGQFSRFIDLIVDYKWLILIGAVPFIVLVYWLWRR